VLKDLMVRHDLDPAVFHVLRTLGAGHDHVARIPGDDVSQRIVRLVRHGQTTPVRTKSGDAPAFRQDTADE
jgi:hypothetical protein